MDRTEALMTAAKYAAELQRNRHAVVTLTLGPDGVTVRATATMETAHGRRSHKLIIGWDEIILGRVNVIKAAMDVVAGLFPARVFKTREAS